MRYYIAKYFYFLITILATNICLAQSLYSTTSAEIGFFSEAPIENIKAESDNGISVLNIETGELAFQVKINTFQFEKALMQEHFNENYMESDKYPKASFKGKILNFEHSSNASQEVIVKGDLTIHGVTRKVEVPATIQHNGDRIDLESTFNVRCEDHKIRIPKLLWKNIAEVIEVQLKANYQKT